ncbi:hypothetical protein ACMZ6Y_10610 [Streptococcus pluranimalium]
MSNLDIYSGKFNYENTTDEYHENLQVDKINNIITLTLTISTSDLNTMPRFPMESEINVIYGKLLTGETVMLYDCYVVSGANHKNFTQKSLNYTTQVIRVSYLFETDIIKKPSGSSSMTSIPFLTMSLRSCCPFFWSIL